MDLTKKILEGRLRELAAQKERLIAQVNACEGGIIVVRGLLSDLDCKNPKTKGGGSKKKARPPKG